MSGRRRARAHELLSVRTRTDILDRLRATSEPLDAHTIAQATGLHVTTVRFHLTALAKAGLVTAAPRRHPGRGRPRLMYSPVWDGDDAGGPYQELAELLAAHFDDTAPRRAERAERAGHTWAAKRLDGRAYRDTAIGVFADAPAAVPTGHGRDATAVVVGLFAEMGFDPEPIGDDRILLHACPFRVAAKAYPEVVCAAHRGLLRATVARCDPSAPVPDMQAFAGPDLCVATLPR